MASSGSPKSPSLTARLALWCARHRWRVVIAWVLSIVVAMFVGGAVGTDTDIDQGGGGESGKAAKLFEERFEEQQSPIQETVVFSHPSLSVDSEEYRATVQGLMREMRRLRANDEQLRGETTVLSSNRVVSDTTSFYDGEVPRESSPFVAPGAAEAGGDVTFAFVELAGDDDDAFENVDQVLGAVVLAQARSPAFEILIGGDASINRQQEDILDEDFAFALVLNLPITFLILTLAFGAVVAAFLPLILAFTAILISLGVLGVISQAYALHDAYSEIVLLMGLATGIDYALFVVTRYRNERRAGLAKEDAIARAAGTAGKAVVFAGLTVLLALTGMFFAGNVAFTSLGLAAIVVVGIAVLVSVTMLPALLALFGDRIERLRIPFLGRPGQGGGIWGTIADQVLARPAIFATLVTVALLALAYPLLTINLGANGARGFDDAVEAKAALLKLEDSFTQGLANPAFVLIDPGKNRNVFAEDIQNSVNTLTGLIQNDTVSPDKPNALFGSPIQRQINDAGDTELLRIPINGDIFDDNAIEAVNTLRDDLIPAAFGGGSIEALVTGITAGSLDDKDSIVTRTPLVLGWVMLLVLLLLLVVFRSIIIPIKAIILNSLSVAAAYGFLVLVFQEGWLLEGILDFKATGIIEFFLPLFLFSIIFGLSQDYHIFVLSRIKESYERSGNNEESVSVGIKATAPTITSAAVVIVAVASIFAFTRIIFLKQFGVGLAVAVLIDATVIRAVLLPASMKLLGDLNWYLPSWLQWIPRISMDEGGDPGGDETAAPAVE